MPSFTFPTFTGKIGLPWFSVPLGYPGRADVAEMVKPVNNDVKGFSVLILPSLCLGKETEAQTQSSLLIHEPESSIF